MPLRLERLDGLDAKIAYLMLKRWHPQGAPRGAYELYGYVDEAGFPRVILMFTPANPLVVEKLVHGFNPARARFLRRILTLPPWWGTTIPSQALKPDTIFSSVRHVSLVYSFALRGHTGALYRHAGWREGYTTPRGLKCFWIMRAPRAKRE